ncbi:MAG TPA: GNAT family N-acetyltransferase [Patescibacteria group bacterium]|nr:GNAT family N-acetyltransferase [Patescibacteria group bacterium]
MNIREYQPSDREQIVSLLTALQGYITHLDTLKRKQLTPDFGEKYLSYVLKTISENEGKFFVADEYGTICGFIIGSIHQPTENVQLKQVSDKEGNVMELYVDAMQRGKGVGRRLLATLEAYFEQKSCDFITLNVLEANESSKGFYEKHGYHTRARYYVKPMRK